MITKKILLFFIIFTSLAVSQNFFPLQVGNQYQIKTDWWSSGPGWYYQSGSYYFSLTVSNDSLIGSSVFYKITGSDNSGPFADSILFSYDSIKQKVVVKFPNEDTTRLAVDFNTMLDSEYISYIKGIPKLFTSKGISDLVVLGDTHAVYLMEHAMMTDLAIQRYEYRFSDQIGLCLYTSYWTNGFNAGGESVQTVISAIVDSVIYNPLILYVDSLYPLIDRPIDTFPFLLSVPYTANYYKLIDSFYLSVELIRDDSLIQSNKYNIPIGNPNLSLNLQDLNIGDIIKLRVTITDNSIQKNIAHYPDSGWCVINVLPPIMGVQAEDKTYSYKIEQNYPNPFNPATTIKYQIPVQSYVTIKVYDILGNEVQILVNEEKSAGSYEVTFDAPALSSGIYFYKLKAGNFFETKKMILLK